MTLVMASRRRLALTSAASRAFLGRCRAAKAVRRCSGMAAEAKDVPCEAAADFDAAAPLRYEARKAQSSLIAAFV
jgi:hypothetical protein